MHASPDAAKEDPGKEIVSRSFQTGSNGLRIKWQREFHKFFLPYIPPFLRQSVPITAQGI
ncbi:hypothetical protein MPLB_2420010 [Mesorhizobium sp. ORS 3324]|nr:hypothetical protein MPLB_2420010 [Mesorhizobium sp. ORS 3324]